MKHNQMRQVVFPILAAFIWGTSFVSQDICADSMGPSPSTAPVTSSPYCLCWW